MELIYIDVIETQAFEAAFQRFREVFAAGIMSPLSGTGTLPSSFGGDDQIGWVWIQRFRNQLFRDSRSVGISRVDEVHVEVDRTPQRCKCGVLISGGSPYARTGDTHSSVSEAIDREVAANCERTSGGCRVNLFVNDGFSHSFLSLVLRLSISVVG